ncbi:MAG: cytochrome c3 family protein [Planctomycetes bacterium]|nr:cytochrome c3 family protein [Planctomycetota bacterium]
MRRVPLVLAVAVATGLASVAGVVACRGGGPPTKGTGEVALETWKDFFRPPNDRIPSKWATNPGTPWGDYVGSRACEACHTQAYAGWRDSFHSRTLYDVVPQTVFGDYSGATTYTSDEHPFTVVPQRLDDRFVMRIQRNPAAQGREDTYGAGVPAEATGVFEVLYAFGNRRHQPYVTKTKDGRHWVLPVYWNDVKHEWMWDGWRPYVTSCAHCHVTGIRSTSRQGRREDELPFTGPVRWNVAPQDEGWAEGSVGCELCHGPGKGHLDAVARMGDDGYRTYLAGGGAATIYNPARDTAQRRMQQCDQCHNFFTESQVTWVPKPDGYGRDPYFRRVRPDEGQFYEDGTDMSPCTVGHTFRESGMGKKGLECRDCHDAHGNPSWAEVKRPVEGNALCLHCHREDASRRFADDAAVARHTRHRLDGPGSLCVECHMPRDKHFTNGIQLMSAKLPSHAFTSPTGREADDGGPPATCNFCHVDRDGPWTRKVLEAWKAGTTPPR